MRSFMVLVSTFTAFTAVIAVPTGEEKRASVEVKACTGTKYSGTCDTVHYPADTCKDLSGPYVKHLGSLKPASKTYCRLYSKKGCGEDDMVDMVYYPGVANLFDSAQDDAGHKAVAIFCYECSGCP